MVLLIVATFSFVELNFTIGNAALLLMAAVIAPMTFANAIPLGRACSLIRLRYGIFEKKSAPLPFSVLGNPAEFDLWVLRHRRN